MAIRLPDAPDLDPRDITPTKTLVDSTAHLDDFDELNRRYENEGYLYFSKLIDIEVVREARSSMLAVLEREGIAEADGEQFVWTGGDRPNLSETSEQFSGIADRLVTDPRVNHLLEKILGEPASTVPMVQYRAYKPNGKLGNVHQDGFYSPGVRGYRPLWIALVDMEPAMGGLVLAPNHTDEGYFHNVARPPRCPIPEGVIPVEDWASIEYAAGDVVVLNPNTPHVGLPNRSGHMRVSIDTRVQSAANPSTLVGEISDVELDRVTLTDTAGHRTLSLDDDSFIRTSEIASIRMTPQELVDSSPRGLRVIAAVDDDRVLMLRRAHNV